MRCEDYPCCGHTDQDPCERQWYDEQGAFDTTKNPHALCDHENGECSVEDEATEYEQGEWESRPRTRKRLVVAEGVEINGVSAAEINAMVQP